MSAAHHTCLLELTGKEVAISINMDFGNGFSAVVHGTLEKQCPTIRSHPMFEIRVNSGDEHAYGYAWVEFCGRDVRRIEMRASGAQRPTIWLRVLPKRSAINREGSN
jgi:hypothetical protein